MVRRKDIEAEINGYLEALSDLGFPYEKAVLFGSFSKGNPHEYSDIDLAVWSAAFTEDYFKNIERTARLRRTFKNIELHPFTLEDNSDNNPFIKEIENTRFLITPQKEFSFSHLQ